MIVNLIGFGVSIGIFLVVFGLLLTFLTLLHARACEQLVAGTTVDQALDQALRRTAAASAGAGLLMIAAMIPFVLTDLSALGQFGIAVGVAVAIGVFVVRPVPLPTAVEVLGRRSWWPTRSGSGADKPKQAHRAPEPSTRPRTAH